MRKAISMAVLLVFIGVSLTGCDESGISTTYSYPLDSEMSSAEKTSEYIDENSESETSSMSEKENDLEEQENTDSGYYYDMLYHRTLFNGKGKMYYTTSSGLYYNDINPDSPDTGLLMNNDGNSGSTFCVVKGDNVYYQTGSEYVAIGEGRQYDFTSSRAHIKRFNMTTGEVSTIVGSEGLGAYCMDEKGDIYGMVVSKEERAVEDEDGYISTQLYVWDSFVKINEETGSYDVVYEDFKSDYVLVGVYDNKAYYYLITDVSQKTCSLFELNFDTGEHRWFASFSGINGYRMTMLDGKIVFLYEYYNDFMEQYEIHYVDLSGNIEVILTSKNSSEIFVVDNDLYVSQNNVVSKVVDGEREYIGVPQEIDEIDILFVDPFTKKLSYIGCSSFENSGDVFAF